MSKNVFVSYKFKEKNWKDNGLQFFQGYGGKVQATPVTIDDGDINDPTNAKIKDEITTKLKNSAGLLVVVGHNGRSDWVEYEVGVALSLGKKVAVTQHPQAPNSPLPSNAHDNPKVEKLDWSQDDIAKWVSSL